jgi:hypothetical protein
MVDDEIHHPLSQFLVVGARIRDVP